MWGRVVGMRVHKQAKLCLTSLERSSKAIKLLGKQTRMTVVSTHSLELMK